MKSLLGKVGIVLIIELIIFGFAELCNAQNWVLWESSGDLPSGNEVPWHIVGAYPSYNSCREIEERICTKYASDFSKNIKDVKCYESWGGHTVTAFYNKNQRETAGHYGFAYGWKCLPDTIDPRK